MADWDFSFVNLLIGGITPIPSISFVFVELFSGKSVSGQVAAMLAVQ